MVHRPLAPAVAAVAVTATAAGVGVFARRRLHALRVQHAETLAGIPSQQETMMNVVVDLLESRDPPPERKIATPITDRIHARLEDSDIATVEARLDNDPALLYNDADRTTRRRLVLNFAAAYDVTPVLERAGMSPAMPPVEVHAMARAAIDAGGDLHVADLLFHVLEHAGLRVPEHGTVLDFGASSGRVLRAVAAGRPDLVCLGCDPNEGAIAWASEHLPMAQFFVSPQRPPLELDADSVDLVYAVSIWSHFAEAPAVSWLTEMHRVLAPGGALVITTHGLDCLATSLRRERISRESATEAAAAILQGRLCFIDVFGPDGDWGVKDAEWGNAYFALEWLLANTGDDWAVRLNWPGALDQVQDVIVLERR